MSSMRWDLRADVQGLLSVEAWRQLFQITDNIYERLALEVLATFELSHNIVAFH